MDRILIDIASGFYLSPPTFPDGVVGEPYSVTITAHGYAGGVNWELLSAPTALSLTDNGDGTATISGTLTQAAPDGNKCSYLVVQATDYVGRVAELNRNLRIPFRTEAMIEAKGASDTFMSFYVVGGPIDTPDAVAALGGPYSWGWTFVPSMPAGSVVSTRGAYNEIVEVTGTGLSAWHGRVQANRWICSSLPESILALELRYKMFEF